MFSAVDEFAALNAALDSGHLFGAAIDAFYPEPLPSDHPLLKNPKVTLSPHVAGATVEASLLLARSAAEQILAALAGTMPAFPINKMAWEGAHSRRPHEA